MSTDLTEIGRARALVLERVEASLEAESVAVSEVLGRVLAADVTSADAIPSFDNSAMDGYAVRAADLAVTPVTLPVAGESRAGHPADRELQPGQAFAISTGAVVPDGADAVVRVEDTDGGDAEVTIEVCPQVGANIRRAGEDVRAGENVIAAGAEIDAAAAGVIASVGLAEAQCTRRPRIAVLTTGDELREPGQPLEPGTIRNSNAYALAALIERAGAEHVGSRIVPDDREATREALATALESDVVVVSGGVSVGEHDHVRPALKALGVEQVFWGVALRPGKPTYFGINPATSSASRPGVPGGSPTLVFGLPGNPVSAMVTFLLFVRPAIRALLGAKAAERPRTTAILDERYEKQPGRAHLIRVRLELRDDGWHARPTKEQGSHVLTSMLGADALAIVPTESASVDAGERVEIELL